MRYKHERNQTHTYAPSTHGYISTCGVGTCAYGIGGDTMSDRLMGFILTLILMAVIWMLLPYIIAIAIKVFWFVGGVVWVVSTLWEWSKP